MDYTTVVSLRDFNSNIRHLRVPAPQLGPYRNLLGQAFEAWDILDDDDHLEVHFHYRRDTPCLPGQLLDPEDWDAGEYFVGGGVEIFAHFVGRRQCNRSDMGRDLPRYQSHMGSRRGAIPTPSPPLNDGLSIVYTATG
ncbi:hypothetical protein NX059_002966 [Plenodomus lindquistii]|nr:hypothetical protein NX059_002966 [Plenodomus lindquistii]